MQKIKLVTEGVFKTAFRIENTVCKHYKNIHDEFIPMDIQITVVEAVFPRGICIRLRIYDTDCMTVCIQLYMYSTIVLSKVHLYRVCMSQLKYVAYT